MEPKTKVKRTICTMCGHNCGILVYVRDDKAVKIRGNPDNPVTRGYNCKRLGHALQWLYHPDQLMYPRKRVGKRGEGKWQRITYDQALDEIAAKLKVIKKKYGPETLATGEGTLRYAEFWMRARFANLFGSPNNFQPGVMCGLNRESLGAAIAGFRVGSKFSDLQKTRCVVIQASNPRGALAMQAQQIRLIKEHEPGRLTCIVIDPRDTGIATEKQDILLRLRPGTDAALMLAWLNVIINENLYDKEFVEKYTYGFDKLTKRVQEYPPEKVAPITGISADMIKKSARIFATTKPATIFGGQGADCIGFNTDRVEQATACLLAITGCIDVPGGKMIPGYPGVTINGKHPLRDSDMELTEMLGKEHKAKQIGGDKFRLMGYPGYDAWGPNYQRTYGIPAPSMHFISASEPLIYRGILNNDPDHIRAILAWGCNPTSRTANTRLVYDALKSPNLELLVVCDFFMTTTAELADYVMPSASYFERCYWTTWEDFSAVCCFGEAAIPPMGERRDDYYFWRGLGIRLGQEKYWPWKTHEEVMAHRAEPIGKSYEEIIKAAGYAPPVVFRKYEKQGFATSTRKFELYSTVLDKLGYDPLPYYREPSESHISTPELAKEYPLILNTGGKSYPCYHSEFRMMGTGLRERRADPIVDINPKTAQELGIKDDDWVYIETKRGKIKQKAHVTSGIDPGVVNCEASFWYPEKRGEEPYMHGLWESSANILTEDDPEACDELVGAWYCHPLLCKIYKV